MTDPATCYHETVDDLRRQLVESHLMWEKAMAPHRDAVMAAREQGRDPDSVPDAVRDAYMASMMASAYSYTLAAALKVAQEHLGEEAARTIAWEIDEILTNGDDDPGRNADVMPEITEKTADV